MSKRARPVYPEPESPSLVGDIVVIIAKFLCNKEEGTTDANHTVSMIGNLVAIGAQLYAKGHDPTSAHYAKEYRKD